MKNDPKPTDRRTARTPRLGRSRARRGAAMVEALVAIPVFIVIFILSIFLGDLYREKLRTIRETKQCAWQMAMTNCEGGCSASAVNSAGNEDLDQGAENNPSQGHPQVDDWLTRGFTKTSYNRTGFASAHSDPGIGVNGFTKTVSTTQVVMCNEKPEYGNFRSIFLYTYHKLTPW